jgi:hypothetical protein
MIKNVVELGLFGCIGFTGFLLVMSYSGIASAMRDEEGNFKKERNFKAMLGGILFFCFSLGLRCFANMKYANSLSNAPGFINLWINSFGVFFVIHIYDLVVLDYLVIVKWHPKFLNLPNTSYYRSFRPHFMGFLRGIPFGIIASLISTCIFLFFFA